MKKQRVVIGLISFWLWFPSDRTFGQQAGQFGVFKVSANIPVARIVDTSSSAH
jgi:hypothetical protein